MIYTTEEAISKLEEVGGIKFSNEQLEILRNTGGTQIVACAGSGKALVNGTGVLTNNGYKPIEKLKMTDLVIGDDGLPHKLIGIYPQGKKKVYIMHFNDHTDIKCSLYHLWTYRLDDSNDWKTDTTETIKPLLKNHKIFIPVNKPVEFKKKNTVIPAYIYGYIIASEANFYYDGEYIWIDSKRLENSPGIEDELKKSFEECDCLFERTKEATYKISPAYKNNKKKWNSAFESLISLVCYKGVKFISNEYLYNDIETRRALLKGIFDNNAPWWLLFMKLEDENLINNIKFLLSSLGFGVEEEINYDTKTVLVRKAIDNVRYISDIEETDEDAEMTCIKIDSDNHLFLTENCVVTHNTTSLTYLVTKRIMTGEISNPNKLLMTTYSKAGAEEMSARINRLLDSIGSSDKVEVKTMHASYYKCLAKFGLIKPICTNAQRKQLIRQAIKETTKTRLEDQDIDTIDSLISYQINNMMTDEDLYRSYVFTVDIKLEDYTNIRINYARKKQEQRDGQGVIDFDDLQYFMYYYLCVIKYAPFVEYCKNQWDYFYVDEFQDTSKIQFAILQELIRDPNKLMVIGDDDQCLIAGTKIETENGIKNIEDITLNDKVLAYHGGDTYKFSKINAKLKKPVNTKVNKITTESGKVIYGTDEHIGFARKIEPEKLNNDTNYLIYTAFADEMESGEFNGSIEPKGSTRFKTLVARYFDFELSNKNFTYFNLQLNKFYYDMRQLGIKYETIKKAIIGGREYTYTYFKDITTEMQVPIYENKETKHELVTQVEKIDYTGDVYDLSVPSAKNFIANDIVVHNCIYGWRGADPTIILNIGAYYPIKKQYLSTNYRCRENILDFAATGIKRMYNREEKDMHSFKEGGKLAFMNCDCHDLYTMSLKSKNYIENELNNGVDPKNIAVLVRNNLHAAVLGNMLLLDGVYVNSTEDMKFSKSPIFKDLENLILLMGDIYTDQCYDKKIAAAMLWKLVKFCGVSGSNMVSNVMDNTGLGLTDALGFMLCKIYHVGAKDFDKNIKLDKATEIKLKSQASRLKSDTVAGFGALYEALKMSDTTKKLNYLLLLYREGMSFTLKDPDSIRVFDAFFKHIGVILRDGGLNRLQQVITMTKQYESGNVEVLGDKVTLTTVHSAKGMEWNEVILLAYDNVSFPSFKNIVSLREEKKTPIDDIAEYIDGERRLNYVALTRAIDKLVLIGDFNNFSLFGLESLGVNIDTSAENIYHLASVWLNTKKFNYVIDKDLLDEKLKDRYIIIE